MASDRDIEEIKGRLSIIDVVGRYLSLKKAGRNYKALCPFHNEKSPSFMVNPELNLYRCFGCGASGDVFSFVQNIDGLGFGEALKLLAQQAGVKLSDSREDDQQSRERALWLDLMRRVAKLYEHFLWESPIGETGRRYLEDRGITRNTAQNFGLGFAPDSWHTLSRLLEQKGYTLSTAEKLGLVSQSDRNPGEYYDRFRNRLMCPVMDGQGRVVGFSGRILGSEENTAKYMNSPETPLFHKSQLLYGYHLAKGPARLAEEMVLVEGNFDVIALHQAGVDTTVAPLGTALSSDQLRLIKRICQQIYLAFDADSAGARAALSALNLAENEGIEVRVIELPTGQDPDLLVREGLELWQARKAAALPVIDYQFKQMAHSSDLSTSLGKTALVKSALPLLAGLTSEVSRSHYLKQLSVLVDTPIDVLVSQLRQLSGANRSLRNPVQTATSNRPPGQPHRAELEVFSLLWQYPELAERLGQVESEWLEHPVALELLAALHQRPGVSFSSEAFYASLRPAAQEFVSQMSFGTNLPADFNSDPDTAFSQVIHRLKLRFLEKSLRTLQKKIAALGDSDDPQVHDLLARQNVLRAELDVLKDQ